jgi:hypothetical protein
MTLFIACRRSVSRLVNQNPGTLKLPRTEIDLRSGQSFFTVVGVLVVVDWWWWWVPTICGHRGTLSELAPWRKSDSVH